ncbi:MAG: CapA family protein [Actinomycetota bacterium]|nr:CapA family protein [Actinomycetota bacterium]
MGATRRERRRRVRRWRRAILGIALAILVIGGVAAAGVVLRDRDDGRAGGRARRTSATTSPTTATTTTLPPPPTARGPLGSEQPVSFAFGGDVHFEGALRSKLLANPESVLESIAPVLSAPDVAVVNLESAVTDRGTAQDKQYVFRAPAVALTALAAAGVDTATAANNHGLDYGAEGLEDTLAAEQSTGFDLIGIGHNGAEAYAPHRMEVNGQRIAAIAATQVLDEQFIGTWTATDTQAGLASAKDVDRLVAAVAAARLDSDTLVVFLHWGVEGQTCPSPTQQTLAQQLVDAGADIVVGSHAHRQEGAGRLGNAFVDYGLGNFVFYNESGASGVTGVLRVTATGRQIDSYDWVPAQIRGGVPQPLDGEPAERAVEAWSDLRGCTGLTP